MPHDAEGSSMHPFDERELRDDEHDQVGTVEVQILLSWFFETARPSEIVTDVPRAA